MATLEVRTNARTQMLDITAEVRRVVAESGLDEALCVVHVPHTTAAVTINENADPDVVRDILMELNKLVPFEDGYHHGEGNSAAHIKSSMFGATCTIPIVEGRLLLGRWQGIYFCEFDGPRTRCVHVVCR